MSNILFISGVKFNKDEIDLLFETRKLEDYNDNNIYENECKKSDLCWYCGMSFNTKKIQFAKDISVDIDGNIIIKNKFGNFNTFNCVKSWIKNNYDDIFDRESEYNKLKLLYKDMTGKDISFIDFAPKRHQMKPYGGNMNINEWLENLLLP